MSIGPHETRPEPLRRPLNRLRAALRHWLVPDLEEIVREREKARKELAILREIEKRVGELMDARDGR